MANLENYKGLQRLDADPSGAGGKAINDNVTAAGDLIETNQNDIATNATAITGKAASVHTHIIGDVTSLQATLDGKMDDVSDDGSPMLAGELNTNGFDIISAPASNEDITIVPDGTGKLIVGDTAGTLPGFSGGTTAVIQNNAISSDDCILALIAGTSGISRIDFGDSGDNNQGIIRYNHSTGKMEFSVLSSQILSISSTVATFLTDIDLSGNSLISTSNADINILPNGGGRINLDGMFLPDSASPNTGDVLTVTGADELDYVSPTMQDFSVSLSTANAAGIGALAALPVFRNGHLTLEFTDAVIDEINFELALPSSYAGGGLVVELFWIAKTVTTGNCFWQAQFERMVGLDLDSDSFAAAQDQITATSGTNGVITQSNIEFTDGSQMDSIAAGEPFRLKILRQGASGSDTLSDDAQLVSIIIREGV